MTDQILRAYLLAGTDGAKIAASRARLRARAEAEGGEGSLEVFEPVEGKGAPDPAAFLASLPAMSLTATRRYLLADGVERWRDAQQAEVAAALASLPPDLTVVLIAHGKPPSKLARAVEAAGGEVRSFDAPRTREMPRFLGAEAKRRGFALEPAAAKLLVERLGSEPVRLLNELDRLALWAGPDGSVAAADLEAMVADTSETAAWALSDALLDRDPVRAVAVAERLVGQGENVTGLVYTLASRLRKATEAVVQLEAGVPPKKVEASLGMHPYAARQLVGRLGDATLDDLEDATAALADLEVWCRGGADYGEELALTLAIRRAAGASA
ncbi:MAG TPA: DNA polymerase III subunit delta [Solirubrobacterales bacterium]|nr:DNA polymerase III subunit delta [Solirubrobacterales bacterium]